MKAILGRKVGMTHIFNDKGDMIPVTVVEAGPCVVTQVMNIDKEGYDAVQIGFGEAKKLKKPQEGHLNKLKVKSEKLKVGKYLREIRTLAEQSEEKPSSGDTITVDIFSAGDIVQIEGVSKGKGFAGVIKRHNFHRGPMSHGSHHHRAPGSIGAGYPQHVFKGQKLPGRMGTDKVTTKGLKIVEVDLENNMIAVKGAIPGPKKGIVLIIDKRPVKNEKVEEISNAEVSE